jgi:quinol monooxygenase YgiN
MVIISGVFEVEPSQREAFLTARTESMRRSRAEPGCLEYVFSADPLEPGRVVLFERWESSEALDAHLAGMRDWPRPDGPQVATTSSRLMRYDVTGERSLR